MTHHYFHHMLNLKVVGFISEDKYYEVYHAQNKTPKRDVILHLLKHGNVRRFDVKDAKQFVMTAQKPSGTRDKAVTPWIGDGKKGEKVNTPQPSPKDADASA